MCIPTITHIRRVCGITYIKGVKRKIGVCPIELVSDIPDPDADTLVVSTGVTFTSAVTGPPAIPAGAWSIFEISKGGKYTWVAEDENDEDSAGIMTFEGFIPGISATKSKILGDLNGHEVLCAIPDNMGNTRLGGELERGGLFRMSEQTDDKPGYNIKITWPSAHPPYFYTQALPT